jgi:hypothetical protein
MATKTPPKFRVQRIDRSDGLDIPIDIGTVTFGPQGELAVVAAEPNLEKFLGTIVEEVNAKKELRIKVPPPAGAKPFSTYKMTVARTAPDLLDVMRTYLQQKYDLVLVEEGK